MQTAGFYDHTESGLYINATADANGLASGSIGPAPLGYCWYVERMTTWSNTSNTSGLLCEIFVQPSEDIITGMTATVGDRGGRQDVSTAAGNDISDQNSPIYVGEGHYLVAFWSGFASGDKVQLSTQVRVHLLSLDTEPRQLVKQQTEPTPDINAEEVKHEDSLVERAEHFTSDLFKSVDKVI